MSYCTCNGASAEPCRSCSSDSCQFCGETIDSRDCTCPFCDACGEKADHTTDLHYFEAGEAYCVNKWDCDIQVGHYHITDELAESIKENHDGTV